MPWQTRAPPMRVRCFGLRLPSARWCMSHIAYGCHIHHELPERLLSRLCKHVPECIINCTSCDVYYSLFGPNPKCSHFMTLSFHSHRVRHDTRTSVAEGLQGDSPMSFPYSRRGILFPSRQACLQPL